MHQFSLLVMANKQVTTITNLNMSRGTAVITRIVLKKKCEEINQKWANGITANK